MPLVDTITNDLKKAMKEKDKLRTNVLRMVLSEFKYAMTSQEGGSTLDDETALKIVGTYKKRLEKSLADYPEGEKKQQIIQEIGLVETYLPQKVDAEEILKAVDQLLHENDDRQFGSLMKQLMGEFGSKADGKLISQVLKDRLKAVSEP